MMKTPYSETKEFRRKAQWTNCVPSYNHHILDRRSGDDRRQFRSRYSITVTVSADIDLSAVWDAEKAVSNRVLAAIEDERFHSYICMYERKNADSQLAREVHT